MQNQNARPRRLGMPHGLLAAFLFPLLLPGVLLAQDSTDSRLDAMSLEELLTVPVTTVSRRAQDRDEISAAVYVITADDIRRSTAGNLPELLRHVPGVSVGLVDGNKYAISVRGFNDRFANKLLVMIDGRSIYTQDFGGVWWDHHDIALQNIARIEIIRGPGGAVWGANAVNGVINIQTKHAKDTQGGLVTARTSTMAPVNGVVRYGGAMGKDDYFRITAKYADRDAHREFDGSRGEDEWEAYRLGARFDWSLNPEEQLTLEADVFRSRAGQREDPIGVLARQFGTISETEDHMGGHIRLRWEQSGGDTANSMIQFTADGASRDARVSEIGRTTYELDFTRELFLDQPRTLIWGFGMRYSHGRYGNTRFVQFDHKDSDSYIGSAFAHYEHPLFDDKLRITLGLKLEAQEDLGLEALPSIRLAWFPKDRHMFWASVSRAVRMPSITEREGRINSLRVPLFLGALDGNRGFDPESLWAYEAGYRFNARKGLWLDVAVFLNRYRDLRQFASARLTPEFTPLPPHILLPFVPRNDQDATTYGVEVAADWQARPWWRLHAAYSFLEVETQTRRRGINPLAGLVEGDSPEQQVSLTSQFTFGEHWELDATLAYVDQLDAFGVDDYFDLDVRLAWLPRPGLSFSLGGVNLLQEHREEFLTPFVNTHPTQAERALYAEVSWAF